MKSYIKIIILQQPTENYPRYGGSTSENQPQQHIKKKAHLTMSTDEEKAFDKM